MAKNSHNSSRPQIPAKIQLKLWVKSGGRCEYFGCNQNLYKDELTLKETNYSNIAHIVSWQKSGPRGEDPLPLADRNNFENLMLVCTKHHKLIDSKEHVKDHPKELLIEFKNCHESRVEQFLSTDFECKTTVISFKANIGKDTVKLTKPDIFRAILPNYPSEKNIEIDLTQFAGDGDSAYWKTMSDTVEGQLNKLFNFGIEKEKVGHISVFAIGPIPLLVHLGFTIGNKIPIQIYQRHRDTQNWVWKKDDKVISYETKKLSEKKSRTDVVLLLSLSGKINSNDIPESVKDYTIYEITLNNCNPNPEFLNSRNDLEEFRKEYRSFLSNLKQEMKDIERIHFLPAIPAPVAVHCGRELFKKVYPTLLVYDYDKKSEGFNLIYEEN